MDGLSPQDRDMLVRTVIGEADSEPDVGKAAVANVVLNRLNAGGYGKTIPDVLLAPKQFEPWSNPDKMMRYSADSPSYKKAASIVDNVLAGSVDDPTGGATHFANVDTVKARGNNSAMKWINGMSNVSQIGSHTFGNADAGRTKMAKNDLDGVDIKGLLEDYGSKSDSSKEPYYTPAQNGQPAKLVIGAPGKDNPLADVDIKGLLEDYGQAPKSATPAVAEQKPFDINDAVSQQRGYVGRGIKDVADTVGGAIDQGAAYVANKVLPESISVPFAQGVAERQASHLAARNEYDAQNPPAEGLMPNASQLGRGVGQMIATAPLMPAKAFTAIGAGMKSLPTVNAVGEQVAAPLLNRLGAATVQGGLGGGIYGAATSSQNDKSLAENVGENALGGAIAGPVIAGAASAARGLGGKIVGNINSNRASLAKRAEELGIDLKASQVSTNPTFKKYDQISGMLPFSGAQGVTEKQIGQFSRAASKLAGEDTENITPQVIQNAKKRIGKDYDTVAANTQIKLAPDLQTKLSKAYDDAERILPPDQFATFKKQLQNIAGKFQNGEMPGDVWQSMRRTTEPMSRLINSRNNVELGQSVKAIQQAMDEAFNASAPKSMQDLLKQANRQYKVVKTLEPLVNGDAEGHVSPLKLMQKVNSSPGGKLRSGELGELADIGRAFFPTSADSGTPLGEKILGGITGLMHSPLSGAAAVGAAVTHGSPILDMGASAVGLGVNRLIRSGMNSKAITRSMINAANGKTYGAVNKLGDAVTPYSFALAPPRDALRLTDDRRK